MVHATKILEGGADMGAPWTSCQTKQDSLYDTHNNIIMHTVMPCVHVLHNLYARQSRPSDTV